MTIRIFRRTLNLDSFPPDHSDFQEQPNRDRTPDPAAQAVGQYGHDGLDHPESLSPECVDQMTGVVSRAMMQAHLRETLGTFNEVQVPFGIEIPQTLQLQLPPITQRST